jgi:hypothetical protein
MPFDETAPAHKCSGTLGSASVEKQLRGNGWNLPKRGVRIVAEVLLRQGDCTFPRQHGSRGRDDQCEMEPVVFQSMSKESLIPAINELLILSLPLMTSSCLHSVRNIHGAWRSMFRSSANSMNALARFLEF